ncbi:MAG: 3'-5' exonuclease [Steroidobacteraceae bacterium]
MQNESLQHDPLVVLDFETTGMDPDAGDRITEVGLVRLQSGRIVARYQSLVNCGVRIPSYITAYTGISQAMVDHAPPVTRVLRELLRFIDGAAVVSHGATFDRHFLERECAAADVRAPGDPFICSMRLARQLHPELKCHALGALAYALKLPTDGIAHRAPADAELTAHLMLRLGAEIEERKAARGVSAGLLRQLSRLPRIAEAAN